MSGFQELTTQVSLWFGDGRMFFIGCLLAVIGVIFSGRLKNKWARAFDYSAWIGMLLIIISATPLPLEIYAVWLLVFLAAMLGHQIPRVKFPRTAAMVGFGVITLAMCIWELQFHRTPTLNIAEDRAIFVIGDSISAGIGGPETTWPEVWAQQSGREIINLAVPGAKIEDALTRQLERVDRRNSTVIVEIGGNDLMGDTTTAEFEQRLAGLLFQLNQDQHQVIMFELPLLPLKNGYGLSQRILATKYSVTLIPKRFLVDVFEAPGATLDGLHLSQTGHDELARRVQEWTDEGPK